MKTVPRLPVVAAAVVFAAACLAPPVALLIHVLRNLDDPGVAAAFAQLGEPAGWAALLRTIRIGVIVAAVCVGLGVPYAVLIARTSLPGRRLWEPLTFLGLLLPPYFSTVGWMDLLGFEGTLTRALGLAGGASAPVQTEFGVVLVLTGALFPVVPLLTAYALRRVRPELEDAARLETNALGVIRRVTLPAVAPDVAAAGLLVFVLAIGGFAATDILTGARLYGAHLFAAFNEFSFGSAAAAVLLLPLIAVAAVVLFAFHLLTRRASAAVDHLRGPTAPPFASGPAGRAAGLLYVAAVWGLTVGVPVLTMLRRAIPAGGTIADGWDTYVLAWRQAVQWPAGSWLPRGPAADSIVTAAAAGLVAALTGFALAGGIAAFGPAGRARLSTLALLPMVLPSALLGIGLIHLRSETATGAWLGRDVVIAAGDGYEWVLRIAWLILPAAYVGRFAPLAVKVLEAGFRRLERSVAEAAAVDGATPTRAWSRVVFPILRPYVVAAGLLVFALSLGEVDCVRQIVPPRMELMSQAIYEQAHRNLEHNLAGLCLVLLTAVAAAGAAAYALLGRALPRADAS
jgi:iron(III) transport system permease protein